MKRLASLVAIGLTLLPLGASAEPAVRLLISSSPCLIEICPATPPPAPTTAMSGIPFGIYIAAVDGTGGTDTSYLGTVSYSSSDPLATLPASYSFITADRGVKSFSTVLRTSGSQTITVSDPGNNLIPGTLVMTVTGAQSLEDIPVLSPEALLLLAVLLAAAATLVLRLKG